jgi:ornithine carbamoyltransferase
MRAALHQAARGKILAMIFMRSSTRTRVSFEVEPGSSAVTRCFSRHETAPMQPTRRADRRVDGIMIKTCALGDRGLARYADMPSSTD